MVSIVHITCEAVYRSSMIKQNAKQLKSIMLGILHVTCEAVHRMSMINQDAKQLISIMVGTVRVKCEAVYRMSITPTRRVEVVVKPHIATRATEPLIPRPRGD